MASGFRGGIFRWGMSLGAGAIVPVQLAPPTPVSSRELASLLNIRKEMQQIRSTRWEDLPKPGASNRNSQFGQNLFQALNALQDYSNVVDQRLRNLAVALNALGLIRDPSGNITLTCGAFTVVTAGSVFILSNGGMLFGVPPSSPDDGSIPNSHAIMWVNEATDELTIRIRYSDGTLKTGIINLV